MAYESARQKGSLNDWDKGLNEACTDEDKGQESRFQALLCGEYLALALNNAHQIQQNLY